MYASVIPGMASPAFPRPSSNTSLSPLLRPGPQKGTSAPPLYRDAGAGSMAAAFAQVYSAAAASNPGAKTPAPNPTALAYAARLQQEGFPYGISGVPGLPNFSYGKEMYGYVSNGFPRKSRICSYCSKVFTRSTTRRYHEKRCPLLRAAGSLLSSGGGTNGETGTETGVGVGVGVMTESFLPPPHSYPRGDDEGEDEEVVGGGGGDDEEGWRESSRSSSLHQHHHQVDVSPSLTVDQEEEEGGGEEEEDAGSDVTAFSRFSRRHHPHPHPQPPGGDDEGQRATPSRPVPPLLAVGYPSPSSSSTLSSSSLPACSDSSPPLKDGGLNPTGCCEVLPSQHQYQHHHHQQQQQQQQHQQQHYRCGPANTGGQCGLDHNQNSILPHLKQEPEVDEVRDAGNADLGGRGPPFLKQEVRGQQVTQGHGEGEGHTLGLHPATSGSPPGSRWQEFSEEDEAGRSRSRSGLSLKVDVNVNAFVSDLTLTRYNLAQLTALQASRGVKVKTEHPTSPPPPPPPPRLSACTTAADDPHSPPLLPLPRLSDVAADSVAKVMTRCHTSRGQVLLDSPPQEEEGRSDTVQVPCDSTTLLAAEEGLGYNEEGEEKEDGEEEEEKKCGLCSEEFQKKQDARNHQRTHQKYKPHACRFCGQRFIKPSMRIAHQRLHTARFTLGCVVCGLHVLTKYGLRQHVHREHYTACVGETRCRYCPQTLQSVYQLRQHFNTHRRLLPRSERLSLLYLPTTPTTPTLSLTPVAEEEEEEEEEEMEEEEEEEEVEEEGEASQNLKTSNHDSSSRSHTDSGPPPLILASLYTSATTPPTDGATALTDKTPDDVPTRMMKGLVHTVRAREEWCRICQKDVPKSQMRFHERDHADQKPYECPLCQKRFGYKNNMKSHMKLHAGIKPFQCQTCGARFTRGSTLRRHARRHTAANNNHNNNGVGDTLWDFFVRKTAVSRTPLLLRGDWGQDHGQVQGHNQVQGHIQNQGQVQGHMQGQRHNQVQGHMQGQRHSQVQGHNQVQGRVQGHEQDPGQGQSQASLMRPQRGLVAEQVLKVITGAAATASSASGAEFSGAARGKGGVIGGGGGGGGGYPTPTPTATPGGLKAASGLPSPVLLPQPYPPAAQHYLGYTAPSAPAPNPAPAPLPHPHHPPPPLLRQALEADVALDFSLPEPEKRRRRMSSASSPSSALTAPSFSPSTPSPFNPTPTPTSVERSPQAGSFTRGGQGSGEERSRSFSSYGGRVDGSFRDGSGRRCMSFNGGYPPGPADLRARVGRTGDRYANVTDRYTGVNDRYSMNDRFTGPADRFSMTERHTAINGRFTSLADRSGNMTDRYSSSNDRYTDSTEHHSNKTDRFNMADQCTKMADRYNNNNNNTIQEGTSQADVFKNKANDERYPSRFAQTLSATDHLGQNPSTTLEGRSRSDSFRNNMDSGKYHISPIPADRSANNFLEVRSQTSPAAADRYANNFQEVRSQTTDRNANNFQEVRRRTSPAAVDCYTNNFLEVRSQTSPAVADRYANNFQEVRGQTTLTDRNANKFQEVRSDTSPAHTIPRDYHHTDVSLERNTRPSPSIPTTAGTHPNTTHPNTTYPNTTYPNTTITRGRSRSVNSLTRDSSTQDSLCCPAAITRRNSSEEDKQLLRQDRAMEMASSAKRGPTSPGWGESAAKHGAPRGESSEKREDGAIDMTSPAKRGALSPLRGESPAKRAPPSPGGGESVAALLCAGRLFHCRPCDCYYTDQTMYRLHRKLHPLPDQPFLCFLCRHDCQDNISFSQHMLGHLR